MSNIRTSLLGCVDKMLGVREGMGADLAKVDLITRTWSGERPGDGTFTDTVTRMDPLPGIKDFSHDVRVTRGGAVKQGDLILTSISQNAYPDEATLRTDTGVRNVEKFLKVGDHYYRTIHVKKRLVTWDVHVRKVNVDETE